MARTTSFTKRSLINKANSTIVIATTAAAFVLVFALVAGKSLLGQMSYQSRVLDAKHTALDRLNTDLDARNSLERSYTAFVADNPNVLGGNPDGTSAKDGNNSRLMLDALPSKYDFPALATSLEKLINDQNLKIMSISGIDEEVAQADKQSSSNPIPVAMPFQVQVNGSYKDIQNFIDVFQRSIRPLQIRIIDLSGDEGSMIVRVEAQTFFQPEKNLNINTKVVQ